MHLVSLSKKNQNSWIRQSGLGADDNHPTSCPSDSTSPYCSSTISSSFDLFSKQSLSPTHLLLARNNMPNARVLIQKSNHQPASKNTELSRACSGNTNVEKLPSNVSGIRDFMGSLSRELPIDLLNAQETKIFSCSLIEFNTEVQDNVHHINNGTTQNLIPWGIYGFYFQINGQNYEIVIYAPVGSRFGSTVVSSSASLSQTQDNASNSSNLLSTLPGQQGPAIIRR